METIRATLRYVGMAIRCIVMYVLAVLVCTLPVKLLSPTDVPPPGAPPTLTTAVAVQIAAIYGLPLLLVVIDFRQWRRLQKAKQAAG